MTARLTKVGGALSNIPGEKLPALPSLDVEELVLHVVGDRKLDIDVRDAVKSSGLHRSITDASTIDLSILDPDRALLRSGRLTRTIDIDIDGLWFRLARVGKSGDVITPSFEDRGAAVLRRYTSPRKVRRSVMTEAQFALSLVRESKRYPLGFYCPELNKRQPIAAPDRQERDALRRPGLPDGAKLTIKGEPANARQLRNIETVLSICEDVNAGPKATKAVVLSCIVESRFQNLPGGDRDSAGIIQVRVGLHGADVAKSIDKSIRAYLTGDIHGGAGFTGTGGAKKVAREHPEYTPMQVAAATNMSADLSNGAAYIREMTKWTAEADAIIETGGGASTDSGSYYEPYEYSRGGPEGDEKESTWDALGRMAADRGWRRFIVANTVFYVADEDLFRGRPRALLTEDDPGVLNIDFTRETSARLASEATVTCLADRWAAPPGSVVLLEGMGPADGRWLVTDIDRDDLFDPETKVTLAKPSEELREPRSTLRQRDGGAGDEVTGVDGELSAGMTPKQVIDQIVLPIARECGVNRSVAQNDAANAAHGPTTTGGTSDHQGPSSVRWAADMSNGGSPTPEMDRLCNALCEFFGLSKLDMTTTGARGSTQQVTGTKNGFRIQIIYRSHLGGDHDNHVHCGVSKA